MTEQKAHNLGLIIKEARAAKGMSARDLSAQVGIAHSNVLRIEQGTLANPRPAVLEGIAAALDIELADLYAAAGYVQPGLPSFAPYLRSKYSDLPALAQRELQQSFEAIADKYGYDARGPQPGQDEQ